MEGQQQSRVQSWYHRGVEEEKWISCDLKEEHANSVSGVRRMSDRVMSVKLEMEVAINFFSC